VADQNQAAINMRTTSRTKFYRIAGGLYHRLVSGRLARLGLVLSRYWLDALAAWRLCVEFRLNRSG